jgi:Holliday junction resolvase RusA-like endonuclease
MIYQLRHDGEPVPKPRMTRSDKWREPVRPAVAAYWAYKDEIILAAYQAGYRRGETVIKLELEFHLPMPGSLSRAKREQLAGQPHMVKPDLDNLVKAILDSLSDSDQTCWSITARKYYASPDHAGVNILIETE